MNPDEPISKELAQESIYAYNRAFAQGLRLEVRTLKILLICQLIDDLELDDTVAVLLKRQINESAHAVQGLRQAAREE